jgi:outer membrane immunogenic protein
MGMYRFLKTGLIAAALVSTPILADAADRAPAPVYRAAPINVYNWSGFYVGGHVGVGWTGGDNNDSGFLGGGQAGYNYQIGQWVLGAEGQVSATDIKNTVAKLDWISTFAARAGWAFNQWLVYGKVGGAWAHANTTIDALETGNAFGVRGRASASTDKTFDGWMLGLGAEYALRNNWTAKVEYNMMDFGNDFVTDGKVHVVKVGVNYHFGFGPKY